MDSHATNPAVRRALAPRSSNAASPARMPSSPRVAHPVPAHQGQDENAVAAATILQKPAPTRTPLPASPGAASVARTAAVAEPQKTTTEQRKRLVDVPAGDWDDGRPDIKRIRRETPPQGSAAAASAVPERGDARATVMSREESAQSPSSDADSSAASFVASHPDSIMEGSTILTEPDLGGGITARPGAPMPMSRERARRIADIICLRLGLAMYKVHTGQTDVPFSALRPLLPPRVRPTADPASPTPAAVPTSLFIHEPDSGLDVGISAAARNPSADDDSMPDTDPSPSDDESEDGDEKQVEYGLPRLPSPAHSNSSASSGGGGGGGGGGEDEYTNKIIALQGTAASGLIRLARGQFR